MRAILSGARGITQREEAFLIVFFVVVFVFFAVLVPALSDPATLSDLAGELAPNLIAALGVAILMLQREFDVSIGSVVALVGVVTIWTFNATASIPLGIAAGLGSGMVVGAIHGYLVVYQRLNSLITTLATLFLIRGLVYVWTQQVTVSDQHGLIAFENLYYGSVAGIPVPLILVVLLFVAGGWFMSQTSSGLAIYAMGGNESSARALGIHVRRLKFFSFVACSALAALAGLVLAAQTDSGYFDAGLGFEFIVIAAVVLGGVALTGGRGTVYGAALGVLIIGMTGKGLRLLGVYTTWQLVATGLFMMLAVFGYGVRERWERRRRQLRRRTIVVPDSGHAV